MLSTYLEAGGPLMYGVLTAWVLVIGIVLDRAVYALVCTVRRPHARARRLVREGRRAQAQRLLLAHISDGTGGEIGRLDGLQGVEFAARLQGRFELEGVIEVIFDRGLAAPGDENQLLDAAVEGLLHRMLDHRAVNDRQHLLGHGLGRRQKARPQAGDRQDRFANSSQPQTSIFEESGPLFSQSCLTVFV